MSIPIQNGHLVWVTRSLAVNPAHILEVFHGRGGEIEVYLSGRVRHLQESDLTDDGRALLLPPTVDARPFATARPSFGQTLATH